MLLYLLMFLIFILGVFYLTYIPLPEDIADRKKLQVTEFLLRLGNEYGGDLLESFVGPKIRNKFTRLLMAIGWIIPVAAPAYLTIRDDIIRGVRVRVYTPKEKKSRAAMIFIHGGGWATMRPEYYDVVIFPMVKKLGMTVFSIDYRLAPEHPYPAAPDDCEDVVRELYTNKYKEYDIDRDNLCLVGDSAGGNLTAVISQRLAATGDKYIKSQVLIYPVTHVFSFHSQSYLGYYNKYKGTALLNPKAMARWILLYMGIEASKENVKKLIKNQHLSLEASEKYTSLFANSNLPEHIKEDGFMDPKHQPDESLSSEFLKKGFDPSLSPLFGVTEGLPRAMVMTAGYDILRDEGIHYMSRLRSHGVPCEWKHYPEAYHGMLNMPYSPMRVQMSKDICEFVQKTLA